MSKNLLDLSLKGFKIVRKLRITSYIPNEINQECVFCDYLKNLIVADALAYNLSLSDSCNYPLWHIYNLWDIWDKPLEPAIPLRNGTDRHSDLHQYQVSQMTIITRPLCSSRWKPSTLQG